MSNNQETKAKVGFLKKLDDYFGITAKGSTFRTEIIGGLTTFFAMCYILFVNPLLWSATAIPHCCLQSLSRLRSAQ